MATLDTRPRAPFLSPLSLDFTGRKPRLKMDRVPPVFPVFVPNSRLFRQVVPTVSTNANVIHVSLRRVHGH